MRDQPTTSNNSTTSKTYLLWSLGFFAVWLVGFQCVGWIAMGLDTHDLSSDWDRAIPLHAVWVWIYIAAYFIPLWTWWRSAQLKIWHRYNRGVLALIIANLVAWPIYLLVPISYPMPDSAPGMSGWVLENLVWKWDFKPGANKLPSHHIVVPVLATLILSARSRAGRWAWGTGVFTFLICLSTLFTKQHLIIDVICGLLLGAGAWWLAGQTYEWFTAREPEPLPALRNLLRRAGILVCYAIGFCCLVPLLFLGIAVGMHQLLPWRSPTFWPGVLLTAIGLLLTANAMWQLSQRGRGLPISHLPPSSLVTTGWYKTFRHPIYIWFTILFAGLCLLTEIGWAALVSLPLFIAAWMSYARWIEEPKLRQRFGMTYTEYCQRVGMWGPRKKRRDPPPDFR